MMKIMSNSEKYEELCEALVGADATERYTFKEILAYAYTLKNIEERYNEKKN